MSSIQILDGGLGTSLEDKYNVKFDHSMPLWSTHFLTTNQDTLLACQRDFAAAGADVLLTATYQVSVEGFSRTKTDDFPQGIPKGAIGPYLKVAVDIAQQAQVGGSGKLALSLGPYGACMVPGQEYSGEYDPAHASEESLFQWHLDRLRLFTATKDVVERVQYVAFETIPRLDEIRAVRRAFHAAHIRAQFWIACVYPGESHVLPDGSNISEIIDAMLLPLDGGAMPWGIGINCTKIDKIPRIVELYEESIARMVSGNLLSTAPTLVVYPDGTNGEVYNTTTKVWEKQNAGAHSNAEDESWAAQLARVVKMASSNGRFQSVLVGGCCKASAEDIKALRSELEIQESATLSTDLHKD